MHTVGHRATVHAKAHGKVAILYSGQLSGPEQAELRPGPLKLILRGALPLVPMSVSLLSLPSRILFRPDQMGGIVTALAVID